MSQLWKLTRARDDWKTKAKNRGATTRALRKELHRIKADRNLKQKKISTLEEKLKLQNTAISIKPNKVALVHITLSLFLIGRIGFCAISRVLPIFRMSSLIYLNMPMVNTHCLTYLFQHAARCQKI